MTFNDEQYKYLEQLEESLGHAVNDNYFRVVNRQMLAELAKIYVDVFGGTTKILNGCSKCILTDIKRLGKAYFEDKKVKNKPKKAENEQIEAIEPKEQPINPKRTKKTATTKKNKKK